VAPLSNIIKPKLNLYPVETYPTDIPLEAKIRLLDKIDKIARSYNSRIKNVLSSFTSEYKLIFIVTSEGLIIGDIQPLCRLNITCIADDNGTVRSAATVGVAELNSHISLRRTATSFTRERLQTGHNKP